MTHPAQRKPDHRTEDPHRTPGQAEGTERDVDQSMEDPQPKALPTQAERDYHGDEPGRTPGQAEG